MDVSPWSVSTTSDFPPVTALNMAPRIEVFAPVKKNRGFSCEEGASIAGVLGEVRATRQEDCKVAFLTAKDAKSAKEMLAMDIF